MRSFVFCGTERAAGESVSTCETVLGVRLTRSATAFSVADGFLARSAFFDRGFILVTSSRGRRLHGRSLDSQPYQGADCMQRGGDKSRKSSYHDFLFRISIFSIDKESIVELNLPHHGVV